MKKYTGKGVYGAVAIGSVSVFKRQGTKVSKTCINDPEVELRRVESARKLAQQQLREVYEKALEEVGKTDAQIFEIHRMMLEDEDYCGSIEDLIASEHVNAEYAVSVTSDHFAAMFAAMDDAYMRARAADVRDVSNRLIACLTGDARETAKSPEKIILCADDLAPSETIALDRERIAAFVTSGGSSNSHTAILARNMTIPAVIGAGETFLETIRDGNTLIVDGHTGDLIVDPDEKTLREYFVRQQEDARKKAMLRTLKGKPNVTRDGRHIEICANIGGVGGIDAALANDAGGIGLFRSEFLYMESDTYPTEEEQFAVYLQVLKRMKGRRVVIRTLDIGADKQVGYFKLDKEANPALGFRAVRLCLTRPEIFRTQLRALYRASAYGKLGIMFPMIASVREVEQCLAACDAVKRELKMERIPFSDNVELGIMIETPAAAIISDRLAPMVDFFSIGTNDLTQYTLACDRQNPRLEVFADPHHEAVLRLIGMTAKNAHAHGTWVSICGELAADTSLTETFLRMGIDELSVSAPFVLAVRDAVRGLDLSDMPQS